MSSEDMRRTFPKSLVNMRETSLTNTSCISEMLEGDKRAKGKQVSDLNTQ
jgi:hypothetical protein